GMVTLFSTTSALAPGYEAVTRTVGGVMRGNWATGRNGRHTEPAKVIRIASTAAKTGRPMKKSTKVGWSVAHALESGRGCRSRPLADPRPRCDRRRGGAVPHRARGAARGARGVARRRDRAARRGGAPLRRDLGGARRDSPGGDAPDQRPAGGQREEA